MNFRSILAAAPLLFASLTGCSPAPLAVVVDNTPMSFNRGITWQSTESQGTWRLTVTGSADPVANAVDDEYSLTLRIDLDDAMLATAPHGVPLTVHGVTHFGEVTTTPMSPDGALPTTYEPASDQSSIVRGLATTASCFCGRGGNETQSYTGTLTLEAAPPNGISVRFDLTLDGQIPFRTVAGQTSHVSLSGVASGSLHP